MSENVYIAGIDMIQFGRYPDQTVPQLGAQAARMALSDAGLTIQDMEALYSGNLLQAGAMVGQRILQEIGQTGIPVTNSANACATGATAFRGGWMAIKAGIYDAVLCVGVFEGGAFEGSAALTAAASPDPDNSRTNSAGSGRSAA